MPLGVCSGNADPYTTLTLAEGSSTARVERALCSCVFHQSRPAHLWMHQRLCPFPCSGTTPSLQGSTPSQLPRCPRIIGAKRRGPCLILGGGQLWLRWRTRRTPLFTHSPTVMGRSGRGGLREGGGGKFPGGTFHPWCLWVHRSQHADLLPARVDTRTFTNHMAQS